MKRSFFAGLGLLALIAAPAAAADLPRQMPYRAPAYVTSYNWTGFYLGAHAGYGWGSSSDGLELSGGFIGGQVGYNWQAMGSPWVLGVEVDSAWADFGRTSTFSTPVGLVSVSSNANYQGSARGRVGYAFDRTMIYVTGGLGWINNEVSINATVAPFTIGISDSQMHIGGVVGAGVEHAIAPNWSVKAEYLYAAYNKQTYFGTLGGGFSADADTHTLKVGLNYHIR
jgi:outer membrane immunogenic protein